MSTKAREKTVSGESAARRSKRTPLGVARSKLSVRATKLEGYRLRWVNDRENRIQFALDGGYEFVKADEVDASDIGDNETVSTKDVSGSTIRKLVGTQPSGQPLYAYLMKIDVDLYKEDQEAKSKEVDRSEEAARSGEVAAFENSYVRPNHGVKYD